MAEYMSREVAFVVTIRGTITMDYDPTTDTAASEFRRHYGPNSPYVTPSTAVERLVQYGDLDELTIATDDSRNLPDEMGGYLMPGLDNGLTLGGGGDVVADTSHTALSDREQDDLSRDNIADALDQQWNSR